MKYFKLPINLFLVLAFVASCVSSPEGSKRASRFAAGNFVGGTSSTSGGSGDNAGPNGGGIGNGDPVAEVSSKVEIRHLVDPIDGTYTRKLTIPKNFTGYLYLSGLNITSLSDRLITVRFNFGREYEKVEVPAVVGRGPGITPTTDIEVLIMDMNSRPFENIRLLYDLYDYNEYDFDQMDFDSGSFEVEDSEDVPVTDNRNKNLYCRGLSLEDDPSYTSTGSGSSCEEEGENCMYAYAKIRDRGLQDLDTGLPIFPTKPNIDQLGLGYFSDSSPHLIQRCLPDNSKWTYDGDYSSASLLVSESLLIEELGGVVELDELEYMFMGAYMPLNKSLWQISDAATIGSKGLFLDTLDESSPEDFGNVSLLFPRYVKRDLNANVEHLSSERPNGPKLILPFPTAGETLWMDGCNERVATLNHLTQEHVGSCNVSASIEIVAKDPATGVSTVVASSGEGGKEVKLQLVKASAINSVGQEVLSSALRSCTNSNGCGGNECCYNNRCWSKDIVSQCMEDVSGTGNEPVGAVCTTDYECSSLCCNQQSGRCAVHDNTQDPPVLCSKPSGQMCIAKEWCQQEAVQECFIVKTGTDGNGNVTCGVRCYNRLRHGDCKNGICTPPVQPQMPVFNPADPNRCDNAIDPPTE